MTTPRHSLALSSALSLTAAIAPFRVDAAIVPLAPCIEPAADHSFFVAYFGYESTEPSLFQELVGPGNRFTPGLEDRGQPTAFLPGYFPRAFRIVFARSRTAPELNWQLQGNTVTVDWTSPLCAGVTLPDPTFSDGFEARP